jgi:hypothetical protein
MTEERVLRAYLSNYNRGKDWEWTDGELHICLELLFGDRGTHHWDNLTTPIQAINEETKGSIVFHQTWHGLHSMKYAAEDLERGILNIPMVIWKNRALFQHLDIVQSAKPSMQI